MEAFDEMIELQNLESVIDDIVLTTGSGGTMAGLAIANYLTGSKFNLHAFCVCDSSKYFYDHLKETMNVLFGMNHKLDPRKMINIISCSKGISIG